MSSRRRRVNTSLIIDLLWLVLIEPVAQPRPSHRVASADWESARREDHDGDPARAGTPLVDVVAGVVVVDQPPELLALDALGLMCVHRDQTAVHFYLNVGMRREVVVPGRVAFGAGLRGYKDEVLS